MGLWRSTANEFAKPLAPGPTVARAPSSTEDPSTSRKAMAKLCQAQPGGQVSLTAPYFFKRLWLHWVTVLIVAIFVIGSLETMFFLHGLRIPTRQLPEIHRVICERCTDTACLACPVTVTTDHSWASKPRSLLLFCSSKPKAIKPQASWFRSRMRVVLSHLYHLCHPTSSHPWQVMLWLSAAWLFSTCWPFSCSESSVK